MFTGSQGALVLMSLKTAGTVGAFLMLEKTLQIVTGEMKVRGKASTFTQVGWEKKRSHQEGRSCCSLFYQVDSRIWLHYQRRLTYWL